MPVSLQGFFGKTVGDLVKFLNTYPQDMPIVFPDRAVLVARAKGPDLILRLDEAAGYSDAERQVGAAGQRQSIYDVDDTL